MTMTAGRFVGRTTCHAHQIAYRLGRPIFDGNIVDRSDILRAPEHMIRPDHCRFENLSGEAERDGRAPVLGCFRTPRIDRLTCSPLHRLQQKEKKGPVLVQKHKKLGRSVTPVNPYSQVGPNMVGYLVQCSAALVFTRRTWAPGSTPNARFPVLLVSGARFRHNKGDAIQDRTHKTPK